MSTSAEKDKWPNSVYDFFAFGPDHKIGVFPTFLIDFGFRPSIGAHFFWDDLFVAGNDFTTDAAWGGSNWITLAMGDRYRFSPDSSIAVAARWNRRPDSLYFVIGPAQGQRVPVGQRSGGGSVTYSQVVRRVLRLDTKARRTGPSSATTLPGPDDPQAVEAGLYPEPPGFGENTTAAELGFTAGSTPAVGNRRAQGGLSVAPAVDVTR
jgi:hypothetical protein